MKIIELTGSVSLRRDVESGTSEQTKAVKSVIEQVQTEGDRALRTLTERFDGVTLPRFTVSEDEKKEAYENVSDRELSALRNAIRRIRAFHERQLRESWFFTEEDGTILGQKITPLDSAGVYVPGGKAAYPSTIMMNVIPAQVAGVKRIVMASPPGKDGKLNAAVLVTAQELGVEEIFKIGGAQAIAALAYGTETVPAVDKITGPGNIFVALAKREVFGHVDIDMIAGPSEIVVLADETAPPEYVAADLLSQAEHDEMASSVLVTTSKALAEKVKEEVEKQLDSLPKKDIATSSLENYGAIYVAQDMAKAVEAVNELAPEHLQVMTEKPEMLLGKIRHAGAIFLGHYSPEPVGDYFAGPNHILPTNGTARFSSPLTVDDFTKKSSIISYSKEAFARDREDIMTIARLEGLEAHARSIEVRNIKGEESK
ncbi:histidinol dehydrogenase [Aliibacillus thermotolerans]|uniref:Histidinol dehydrogenase n=1 Tax=Aliibacillus thermotolerans TaxID=1834418 RepID=A0ABW0U5N0_9BACI|nr:histidinol dehydrogenase [Aliibacillus thermotolerans]MDA3128713.1 histidinol dehydrogenase [Aliibacillus thermotolerans]